VKTVEQAWQDRLSAGGWNIDADRASYEAGWQAHEKEVASLDKTVEKVREAHSESSAYQHMLDAIADDFIEYARPYDCHWTESDVAHFIRNWRPK